MGVENSSEKLDRQLLITATPMQNSLLDIYGLISFIDASVFPDVEVFRERYVGNPAHLPELCDITYELTPSEKEIYTRLEAYLARENKAAFPKMDRYELTLMLTKLFSSSIPAIYHTLQGVAARLASGGEFNEITAIIKLCEAISGSSKAEKFLDTLKSAKTHKKALIFTENRQTQDFLYAFLADNGYKIATFNSSSDYSNATDRFREEFDILIATNLAPEGLCMEFCSFVINYDLPYNAQIMEQRIGRCHRNGQAQDVLVASFVDKDNFADIRLLELIHKRLRDFVGLFGVSDNLIGFENDIGRIIATARTKKAVDKEFDSLQKSANKELKEIGAKATQNLFSSFDSKILDRLMLIQP